jgi:hypothetical protein
MARWGKKFNFEKEDKEWVLKFLDERDKVKYPVDADYLIEYLKSGGGILTGDIEVTPEQIQYYEEIKDLCPRKLITIIGNVPTCTHRLYNFGIQRMKYFVYQKPHPNAGNVMTYNDIKGICDKCTQGFSEDERLQEIKKLYETKEVTIYMCNNPNADSIESTAFRTNKFVCPSKEGRHVRIDRTCIKTKCEYLLVKVYPLPVTIEEEN